MIEDWTGKSWADDEETAVILNMTVSNLLKNYRDLLNKAAGRHTPVGDFEGKTPDELGQMFAALGGLAPPRPRKPVSPPERSEEQLEARARSKGNMRKILSEGSSDDDGDT